MYNYDENKASIVQLEKYYKIQKKQQLYFKRLRFFLVFVLLGVSGYLFDQRPEVLSANKAFLALGIIWAGLIPSLQYLFDRQRPPVPFLPLIGIFYATTFGLPMFSAGKKVHYVWSLENVSEQALLLTLLGVAGMNIAFYFFKYSFFKKVTPIKLTKSYQISKLTTLLWVLLILHILNIYIPSIREIPSLGQFLRPVGYFCYGMFYILSKRGYLASVPTWILVSIFVPLEIIPIFISGALSPIMLLGLYMAIIVFHESKRIPIFLATGVVIFLLIFNPVKSEYRQLTWSSNRSEQLNSVEKAQLFIKLVIEHYSSSNFKQKSEGENSTIARTAHILVFSAVIEDTPNRVPYWQGQTYLPLATSFIPRIIFPDKPEEKTGNLFGRRYNYLSSDDSVTSFNLPWIVEMYANFGYLGVLIGMPLVGVVLVFLDKKLNNSSMNTLEFVAGATIIFQLVYQESNFSLMMGGVISLSVALYLLFNFVLSEQHKQ